MNNPASSSHSRPDQPAVDAFVQVAAASQALVAEFLDKYPAAVDEKDSQGLTALVMATVYGSGNMVEFLLKRGASVDKKDSLNRTPLMLAAGFGRADVVEALLAGGAAIDAEDDWGRTALKHAQEHDKTAIVALLEQWPEKEKQRLLVEEAEREARFLKETDFSKGLEKPIPKPRPFKTPPRP